MSKQAGRFPETEPIIVMKSEYQPIKRGCDLDTCEKEGRWSRAYCVKVSSSHFL